MASVLAVLLQSEAFDRHWPDLAGAAGVALRLGRSLAEFPELESACGLVVAAGGREEEVVPVLRELRGRGAPPVAVVGAAADYRLGITLVQEGAADYFVLPRDFSALQDWMAQRAERVRDAAQARTWAAMQRDRFDFSHLIGESAGLRAALERAAKVIPRGGTTVLITGETGTGKDLLARAIHYNGPRVARPMVEVNCTALPAHLLEAELFGYERGAFTDAKTAKPGLFEAADGGTLFLDEIGDLSPELQAKLLRALETKRVRRLGSVHDLALDVRIIAATHVELTRAVREGRFRRDLFFRLNVAPIHLPPLRERDGDVLLLAGHFLARFCAEYELPRPPLTPRLRRALLEHAWPGNVRELKNAIERALLFGEKQLDPADLFYEAGPEARAAAVTLPFPASLAEIERAAAREMVQHYGGNKSEAARALGVSRKHLYSLLRGAGER